MNTCLKDGARTVFDSVDTLSGFEAWRAIVQEIQKSRGIRLAQLRKVVRGQPKIAKTEDVASGILKFENNIRDYVAAGGERPNDKELKSDLLDTLPQEIRENLVWRLPAQEPFSAFRDHVRTAAHEVLYHRGRLSAPIHNVEEPDEGSKLENLVGAIMKKMGYNRNGQGNKANQGNGNNREASTGRKPRCANCSSEKHATADCDKPKVPIDKRPCHVCGKPGHTANRCRSKGRVAGSL